MAINTKLRLNQLSGSYGSATGVKEGAGWIPGSMIESDLVAASTGSYTSLNMVQVMSHVASSLQRIHGAPSGGFSNNAQGKLESHVDSKTYLEITEELKVKGNKIWGADGGSDVEVLQYDPSNTSLRVLQNRLGVASLPEGVPADGGVFEIRAQKSIGGTKAYAYISVGTVDNDVATKAIVIQDQDGGSQTFTEGSEWAKVNGNSSGTATNIATAINSNAKFSAAVDPTTNTQVNIQTANGGTSGNGKTVTLDAAMTGDGWSKADFVGGSASPRKGGSIDFLVGSDEQGQYDLPNVRQSIMKLDDGLITLMGPDKTNANDSGDDVTFAANRGVGSGTAGKIVFQGGITNPGAGSGAAQTGATSLSLDGDQVILHKKLTSEASVGITIEPASAKKLQLNSVGAADIDLLSGQDMFLMDADGVAADGAGEWAEARGVKLSESQADWKNFEDTFPSNLSILGAIVQAAGADSDVNSFENKASASGATLNMRKVPAFLTITMNGEAAGGAVLTLKKNDGGSPVGTSTFTEGGGGASGWTKSATVPTQAASLAAAINSDAAFWAASYGNDVLIRQIAGGVFTNDGSGYGAAVSAATGFVGMPKNFGDGSNLTEVLEPAGGVNGEAINLNAITTDNLEKRVDVFLNGQLLRSGSQNGLPDGRVAADADYAFFSEDDDGIVSTASQIRFGFELQELDQVAVKVR
jgi:hypothetical protein